MADRTGGTPPRHSTPINFPAKKRTTVSSLPSSSHYDMATRKAIALIGGFKNGASGALHIHCRVKPGVDKRREGITGVSEDAVEICVAAPPRDGESNKAVIKVMSDVRLTL
jgi:hypothetical protein